MPHHCTEHNYITKTKINITFCTHHEAAEKYFSAISRASIQIMNIKMYVT